MTHPPRAVIVRPGRCAEARADGLRGMWCRIVVAGLPAAGKSTLALALEQDLHAVRLSADDWMTERRIDLLGRSRYP